MLSGEYTYNFALDAALAGTVAVTLLWFTQVSADVLVWNLQVGRPLSWSEHSLCRSVKAFFSVCIANKYQRKIIMDCQIPLA